MPFVTCCAAFDKLRRESHQTALLEFRVNHTAATICLICSYWTKFSLTASKEIYGNDSCTPLEAKNNDLSIITTDLKTLCNSYGKLLGGFELQPQFAQNEVFGAWFGMVVPRPIDRSVNQSRTPFQQDYVLELTSKQTIILKREQHQMNKMKSYADPATKTLSTARHHEKQNFSSRTIASTTLFEAILIFFHHWIQPWKENSNSRCKIST